MDILFWDDVTGQRRFVDFIEHIVNECGSEFFPPLGWRTDTQQTDFEGSANALPEIGSSMYVEKLLTQKNIFAMIGDKVVGFMSFIYNCKNPLFDVFDCGSNNYISTICVEAKFRGRGIANALYDFIEYGLPSEVKADFTSTRTWSGNQKQLSLLDRRGYALVHREIEDREYQGQKADSVYYAKKNSR